MSKMYTDEKIAEARKMVETLKDQLHNVKSKLSDNLTLQKVAVNEGIQELPRLNLISRRTLKGHLAKIYAMHWATDGNHLVSASQDGKLIIWDAYTANKTHAIPLRSSWVMTCAYSPSRQFVACGGLDDICSIYTVPPINVKSDFKAIELSGHGGYLSCCRFLDDKTILTSSGDMTCAIWDIQSQRRTGVFQDHLSDVMSLSINPVHSYNFVSGSCDATAKLWDHRSPTCAQTFSGHDTDINSIQYFPNGGAFGTGSDDGTCRLFDIRADTSVATYRTDASPSSAITSVAFSTSGRLMFAGDDQCECKVYDVLHGTLLTTLKEHGNRVSCLGVSSDNFSLCTGSWDSTLRVWA